MVPAIEQIKDEFQLEMKNDAYTRIDEAFNMAIKALEQQPSDDVMAIHTQGLDEGIRCAMCTNSRKSDSGCDGGCVVNEDMYKKVMEEIEERKKNNIDELKKCGVFTEIPEPPKPKNVH